MRVPIVEDEVPLAGLIREGLTAERLLADVAIRGEDALDDHDAAQADRDGRPGGGIPDRLMDVSSESVSGAVSSEWGSRRFAVGRSPARLIAHSSA